MEFGVEGLGFRVESSGFRVLGLGFLVSGFGLGVEDPGATRFTIPRARVSPTCSRLYLRESVDPSVGRTAARTKIFVGALRFRC